MTTKPISKALHAQSNSGAGSQPAQSMGAPHLKLDALEGGSVVEDGLVGCQQHVELGAQVGPVCVCGGVLWGG